MAAAMWHSWLLICREMSDGIRLSFRMYGDEFCEKAMAEWKKLGDAEFDIAAAVVNSHAVSLKDCVHSVLFDAANHILADAANRGEGRN